MVNYNVERRGTPGHCKFSYTNEVLGSEVWLSHEGRVADSLIDNNSIGSLPTWVCGDTLNIVK